MVRAEALTRGIILKPPSTPAMNQPIEISREEYQRAIVNSIKTLYPVIRQDSKSPTFSNQYGGTHNTLMRNCGFPAKEAKRIMSNYKSTYAVSEKWTQDRLREASECGYVTAAFGLRVRTPLLEKTIFNGKNTPYEAKKEGLTAGNALGQSWCLLNSRACNEFMQRVWDSEFSLRIRPIAQIHDAAYFLIDNDTEVLKWVNDNLIQCMQWQDHPDIEHPTVKIGAELDVFYPTWSDAITLKNGISSEQIIRTCVQGFKENAQAAA